MSQSERKKRQYAVTLSSTGIHRIICEGYSPEDAFRKLQRKIGGKPIKKDVVASKLLKANWSDPSDKEVWILDPLDKSERKSKAVMIWDGQAMHTFFR
jgi:hypothetical protein